MVANVGLKTNWLFTQFPLQKRKPKTAMAKLSDHTSVTSNNNAFQFPTQWIVPATGVRPAPSTPDELRLLLDKLPVELSSFLLDTFGTKLDQMIEIYLQLGQRPEVWLMDTNGEMLPHFLSGESCVQDHIDLFAGLFRNDEEGENQQRTKRRGIAKTLHRISVITKPSTGKVLGVTVRVGRSLTGLLETMTWPSFLTDRARLGQSLLLIGKPGVGKTTILRQMAGFLSATRKFVVVVIDKTNEIAGDGDTPHPCIGASRWMPVGVARHQHEIMLEAVENQTPHVIIVDEISTAAEVQAARTIAQRGVMLIATVHGKTVPELLNDKERGILLGGTTSVTLSGQQASRRADGRKQVLKRTFEPVFDGALELHGQAEWIFHPSIAQAVDAYLDDCTTTSPAVALTPGHAKQVQAVPGNGTFEYCTHCTAMSRCAEHFIGDGQNGSSGGRGNGGSGGGGRGKGRKGRSYRRTIV